ncbi:MAG: PKD domain-containing protein [Gemmatimonadetes bacterium]|nr:MAG: PKD domain-containing protein [Gemmatimonadota bacterium]
MVRYEWDFGDGTRGNQIKTSHEYLEPGTYTVTLTVTDDSGTECATATDQLTVIINEPPLAAVTLDDITACVGCAHDEVYFDASPSKDREGGRLSFQWDFGDGTKGVGMRPTHTYTEPGVYNVTLTVIDDSGTKCNYSTINITVNANRAPTPDIQIRSDAGSKP